MSVFIVESPDGFARDLAVQLAGHDMLKGLGIAICHCVRCRRNWPLRASSTSEASPTPPSLWLRCCGVRDPAPGVSVETSVVENGYLRNRPWAEDPSQSPNRDLP
jgi:hypothetical protein